MPGLKLVYKAVVGQFEDALEAMNKPIAAAATAAIRSAGEYVKVHGRSDIAAALGTKFANALRINYYPSGRRTSVDAAAFVFHRISYANIFEVGGVIRPGSGTFLWLPLPNAPKKIGRERITPSLYISRIGPLRFVKRPGHRPLLVADLRVSSRSAARPRQLFGLAQLRSAAARTVGPRKKGDRSVTVSIPMFVGLDSVTIRKRIHVVRICGEARDKLPGLYAENLVDNR